MNQDQLRQVYEMVDNIPFSKPKKHINRDFADGLMMAELIHHYNSKVVQLHNYPTTNNVNKKIQNWNTLNDKVLKKIGLAISKKQIEQIANVKPQAIQKFLYRVLIKFQRPEEQFKITSRQGNRTNQSQIQKSAFTNIQNRGLNILNRNGNTINIKKETTDTQQILDMIDKIDQSYSKLLKLQEMNKLKEDMIRNLQKKVQKIIFS